MKSLLSASIIATTLVLASCSTTVPVRAKFPAVPPELLKKCEDLKQIEPGKNSITDMLKTVVENYQLYYQCGERVEGWQEWYDAQKKIYEAVK